MLKPIIQGMFAITSMPDPKYGEIVVLVLEADVDKSALRQVLSRYQVPKKLIRFAQIPLTGTQKINRAELKKQVLEIADKTSKMYCPQETSSVHTFEMML